MGKKMSTGIVKRKLSKRYCFFIIYLLEKGKVKSRCIKIYFLSES